MDFYDDFRRLLKASGLSHAKYGDAVGVSGAFISLIATRRSKPPMDSIEAWADAFDLAGIHRQRFLDLAAITTLPDAAQPRFLRILAGFEKADAREQASHALINELESRISALESQPKRRGK